jgi:hypothetical protein
MIASFLTPGTDLDPSSETQGSEIASLDKIEDVF